MTDEAPPIDVPKPDVREHDIIQTMLGSKEWEERLRTAREQRARVLADRGSQHNQPKTPVSPNVPNLPEAPEQWPASGLAQSLRSVAPPRPHRVKASASTGRVLLGLGVGIVCGVVWGMALHPDLTAAIARLGPASAFLPNSSDGQDPDARRVDPAGPEEVAAPGPAVAGQSAGAVPRVVLSYGSLPTADAPSGIDTVRRVPLPTEAVPVPDATLDTDLAQADTRLQGTAPTRKARTALHQTVELSDAPPSAMPPPVQSPDQIVPALLNPPEVDPAPFRGPVSFWRPPAGVDAPPNIFSVLPLAAAQDYSMKVHLVRNDPSADIRALLGELGLADYSVVPSTIAPAQNMVVFYRDEEAALARNLARLIDGVVLDMTGSTSAVPPGTLDLYLAD